MASHTAGMSDAQKDAATSSVSRSTADKMGRRSDEDAFKGRKKKTSARYSSTGGKKRKNTTGRGQPEQYRKSADSSENEARFPYGRSKIVQGKGSFKGLNKEEVQSMLDYAWSLNLEEGLVDIVKKGAKRHSKAVEKKKIKNRKAVPYAALGASYQPEGEVLDELSKTTLGNYVKDASSDASMTAMDYGSKPLAKGADKKQKKVLKRLSGIRKATSRLDGTRDIITGKKSTSEEVQTEDYYRGTGEKVVARTKKWMDKKGQKGAPGLDAMKARTAEHKAKRGVKEDFVTEVIEDDNPDANVKKIDVMKGKNKVKINPNMGEQVQTDTKQPEDVGLKQKERQANMLKKRVLMQKLKAVRSGAGDSIMASHTPQGEVVEAKVDKGRSDYGKATIRNWRHSGPSTVEPAMFDPENKRGKTIDKRREEHKARRGVKGAKVTTYTKEEVVDESHATAKKPSERAAIAKLEAILKRREDLKKQSKGVKEEVIPRGPGGNPIRIKDKIKAAKGQIPHKGKPTNEEVVSELFGLGKKPKPKPKKSLARKVVGGTAKLAGKAAVKVGSAVVKGAAGAVGGAVKGAAKGIASGLRDHYEISELNRYGKETGKATGSINKRAGTPVKSGGSTDDKALTFVRNMIRKETGKPSGQQKKVKGEKGRVQYGDRKGTPADTIAKRRQAAKDAEKLMRDTSGT